MYCINCGADIKAEDVNCPYCGKVLQMVPDYSIYDEDDINVILESTIDIQSTTNKTEDVTSQNNAKKTVKKMDTKKILILTVVLCVVLLGAGIGLKVFVDYQNSQSYEYQMKAGDEALFKNKLDVAESYYAQALLLSPNDTKARLKLADVYFEKGSTNEGIILLNEVIELDETNYDAYKKLFDLYESEGNVDAILNLKEDVTDSKILKLFEDYLVNPPCINVSSGTYSDILKIMLTADKGVQIFYTIDGTNPISHGVLYTDTIELSKAGMNTLKVVAMNTNGIYSDVISATYVIKYNAPADPEVTPNGGTFDTPTYVYINVPEGCSAYYTWDRTDPTNISSEYVSPLLIPEGYNMLSVIIINDTTGLSSGIYRGVFEYITE